LEDARDMPGCFGLTVDALLDYVRRELQFAKPNEITRDKRKDLVVDPFVVDL
jgi:hypothetical protein